MNERKLQQAICDACGGRLSLLHCGELARSAISPEVAGLRGYQSIGATSDRRGVSILHVGYGLASYQAERLPGYLLPRWNAYGAADGAQYKPDDAYSRKHGKDPIKYETPAGARMVLDVPPICQPDLGNPDKPIWITEGIKKGDALASAGATAISLQGVDCWRGTNEDGGKGTPLADWAAVRKNGTFYIAYDSDSVIKPNVKRAEADLARFLKARAGGLGSGYHAKVLIVRVPPKADGGKQGIDDYLFGGGDLDSLIAASFEAGELSSTDDEVRSIVETVAGMKDLDYERCRVELAKEHGIRVTALDAHRLRAKVRRTRPQNVDVTINADSHDLAANTVKAFEAILADNDPPKLFKKGSPSQIVRLAERDESVELDAPHIEILDVTTARGVLVRTANWTRKEGLAKGKPSDDQVKDVLTALEKPLPLLRRITSVPVFAADGTLLSEPGYSNGILYVPAKGLQVRKVSEKPTAEELAEATGYLIQMLGWAPLYDDLDTVGRFPFVAIADRAHAFALGFQHFARELIAGPTPIYGFEADKARTGKGLIFENLVGIGAGYNISHYGPPPGDDELCKKITASALQGRDSIIFDNIPENKYLNAPELASAVTAYPVYSGRILGKSQEVGVQLTNSWVVSVNNPAYSIEIQGRTIRCRLVSTEPHPEDREFKHDFAGWCRANRGNLVWSFLTLIQNWINRGKEPFSGKPLGRFEDWSRVIGGILECSGIDGFLSLRPSEVLDASNDEAMQLAEFLGRWWTEFQDNGVEIKKLVEIAKEVDGFWLGRTDDLSGQARSLGKTLRGKIDGTFMPMGHETRVTLKYTGTAKIKGFWKLQGALVTEISPKQLTDLLRGIAAAPGETFVGTLFQPSVRLERPALTMIDALDIARMRVDGCDRCDWSKWRPLDPGSQATTHYGSPRCEPKTTAFNNRPDPKLASLNAGGEKAHCDCGECNGRDSAGQDNILKVALRQVAREAAGIDQLASIDKEPEDF